MVRAALKVTPSFFTRNLRIGKFKLGVTFSAALTMIIFLAGLSLLLTLFIPLIVTQANNLAGVDYKSIATAKPITLEAMRACWSARRSRRAIHKPLTPSISSMPTVKLRPSANA